MRTTSNERGSIFIFTLLVTMILSIMALGLLPLTVLEYKTSKNFSDFQRAYFVAEAGLEEAIGELDNDWNYDGSGWKKLRDGEYKIDVTDIDTSRIVTATGKIGNIQRALQANIEREDHSKTSIRVVSWREL